METREKMNGKPVFTVPAKSIINFKSGFAPKLLCDGPTFSLGTACTYSCSFCYVPAVMRKSPHLAGVALPHDQVVIRREGALAALRSQLVGRGGAPRFPDPLDRRVIYSSPLVDVAGNMELVRETIEACRLILALTHWDIRLLSKSNLLPKIAAGLGTAHDAHTRLIYGVSTGTLDDGQARAFEAGTPLVSKRVASLHWLQDQGLRTFGMICPSLPQRDYGAFAREAAAAIRADRCEHTWAEVINLRGESMSRTRDALAAGGFEFEAKEVERVSHDGVAWEEYSRQTFLAHVPHYPAGKLRFLQYVNATNRGWWNAEMVARGAVLLGAAAEKSHEVLS